MENHPLESYERPILSCDKESRNFGIGIVCVEYEDKFMTTTTEYLQPSYSLLYIFYRSELTTRLEAGKALLFPGMTFMHHET